MARKRKLAVADTQMASPGMPAESGALARGLEVLRCFRHNEHTLGLPDVASRLGLSRATTLKLLETLAAHQFLRKARGAERYQPGVSCLVLGQALLSSQALLRIARPVLTDLADEFRLNVVLGTRERLDMLCLEHCVGRGAPRFRHGVGALLSLPATALGRAWLWAQPGGTQGELIEQIRVLADERAKRTIPGLYRAFQEMEEFGFCFSIGEWIRDVHAVATPLIVDGGALYSVSCKAIGVEPTQARLRNVIGPALLRAVAAIKDATSRSAVE